MSATAYATIHGSPGEGARMAGLARLIWPLLAAMFLTGCVAGVVLGAWMGGWTTALLAALAGLLLVPGATACQRRIGSFFKGAAGEEIVARELARLPAGWHVFHALDADGGVLMWRGGDIDHVALGPAGMFVIETKNWRGAVTLAGDEIQVEGAAPQRSPLAQARQASSKLQVRLGRGGIYNAEIVPVVCFAGDNLAAGRGTAGEAVVCNAECLREVLTASGRNRTPLDVDGVVRALLSPVPSAG